MTVRDETAQLLDDLAAKDSFAAAWPIIERLATAGDPELVPEIHRRAQAGAYAARARAVVGLLGQLRGAPANAELRAFLSSSDLDAVAAALRFLAPHLTPHDGPMLARFLAHPDHAVRVAAIVAAGHARDPALAPAVAPLVQASSDDERMQAAITLGHLGAAEHAAALAARLTVERGRVFQAFVAALEMLRSREVIPSLVTALRDAPADQVWDLGHALATISGVDVDVEARAPPERLRRAWLAAARTGLAFEQRPARVTPARRQANGVVTFDVVSGRGAIRIDFDPPSPGATWPRWGRSLFVGGRRVLELGSTCGTCESLLRLLEWPGRDPSLTADALEDRRGQSDAKGWVATWQPLLEQLRSGRYVAAALSILVDRIDSDRRSASWFSRRREWRVDDGDGDGDAADVPMDAGDADWPRMTHYQGPRLGDPAAYPMLVPLQDPDRLDRRAVDAYCSRIRSGERPPLVALAWLDDRQVQARWPERFLYLAILNGHHRLEAYARVKAAARVFAVARVDDSWGPPEEPERFLVQAFEPFMTRG